MKGFTLLELLIVIAIIAILATAVVVILNPAELIRRARDAQRMSDLGALKTAIGLYLTEVASPTLADGGSNTNCKAGAGAGTWASGDKIYYSLSTASTITDTTLDGGSVSVPAPGQVTAANLFKVDGTGWIPVNLTAISGGSPIAGMPIDPTNTIASLSAVASTDLVYRYTCHADALTFEIAARLESAAYGPGGTDDKSAKDGGNNAAYYEIGTKLDILGTGTDF